MKKDVISTTYAITLFVISVGLMSCTKKDDTPLLKGRWEMFVGQDPTIAGMEEGIDNLVYSMELNFEERAFDSDNDLPSGGKSYGWMDFSNMSKLYHYDIDSVFALGDYRYRIVSVDNWFNLCVDTLVYNPETKQIIYEKDWVFEYVPDIKPFVGEWETSFDFGSEYVHLNLYEKIKSPDEYPFNGRECYGWIIYDTDVDISYRLITSVEEIHYDYANIKCVFPDYPEDGEHEFDLLYNRKDSSLVINYETVLSKIKKTK